MKKDACAFSFSAISCDVKSGAITPGGEGGATVGEGGATVGEGGKNFCEGGAFEGWNVGDSENDLDVCGIYDVISGGIYVGDLTPG